MILLLQLLIFVKLKLTLTLSLYKSWTRQWFPKVCSSIKIQWVNVYIGIHCNKYISKPLTSP